MVWDRWFGSSHHGKERTTSRSGSTKTEGFVGKKGGGFTTHYSTTTKPSGRKVAHAGRHVDKPKKGA